MHWPDVEAAWKLVMANDAATKASSKENDKKAPAFDHVPIVPEKRFVGHCAAFLRI